MRAARSKLAAFLIVAILAAFLPPGGEASDCDPGNINASLASMSEKVPPGIGFSTSLDRWISAGVHYEIPLTRKNKELSVASDEFGFHVTPKNTAELRWGPYESIPEVNTSSEGVRAINRLWNDPNRVVFLMSEVANRVQKIAQQRGISTREALSAFRIETLRTYGFVQEPRAMYYIASTKHWLADFVAAGRLTSELGPSHSFTRKGADGAYVHQNQWLLIALEKELNPSRFERCDGLSLFDIYRSIGQPELVSEAASLLPKSKTTLGSDNYWYHLFDRVPPDGNGSFVSNASDPFYFVELFHRTTGFERDN